jgi:hypothetical protein
VNKANGGSKYDNQESFLFAEVMKYSYLAHSEGILSSPFLLFMDKSLIQTYRGCMASPER